MKKILFSAVFSLSLISSCFANKSVINNYADIAFAKYKDSLNAAEDLLKITNVFLNETNEKNFIKLKKTWLKSRVFYQQTEVFRFGNSVVDDWEGKVNAWPLDEGLIDYVNSTNYYPTENDFANFNVIANPLLKVEGKEIDASIINANLLSTVLHEAGGNEANVATGYHAIEFLLWGQDLNGTEKGSGNRSFTDYDLSNCTNDNCDRRRQYLLAATELLVSDLKDIVKYWNSEGIARKELTSLEEKEALRRILIGMGSLSYGELAGERMKLGLMLHDPEEEHDCFSDNTHNSHFYNVVGIQNIYLGRYKGANEQTKGESISSLVKALDKKLDADMKKSLSNTIKKMKKIVRSAKKGETYDMLIGEDNKKGNQLIQDAVDALVVQSRKIEQVASLLDIKNLQVEGSDSLDNPEAVFN